MTQAEPLIDAQNVGVTFKVDGGTVEAVRDVSFKLYRGPDNLVSQLIPRNLKGCTTNEVPAASYFSV